MFIFQWQGVSTCYYLPEHLLLMAKMLTVLTCKWLLISGFKNILNCKTTVMFTYTVSKSSNYLLSVHLIF